MQTCTLNRSTNVGSRAGLHSLPIPYPRPQPIILNPILNPILNSISSPTSKMAESKAMCSESVATDPISLPHNLPGVASVKRNGAAASAGPAGFECLVALDLLAFAAAGLEPISEGDYSVQALAQFVDEELISPSRQARKRAFSESAGGEVNFNKRRRASQSSVSDAEPHPQ